MSSSCGPRPAIDGSPGLESCWVGARHQERRSMVTYCQHLGGYNPAVLRLKHRARLYLVACMVSVPPLPMVEMLIGVLVRSGEDDSCTMRFLGAWEVTGQLD